MTLLQEHKQQIHDRQDDVIVKSAACEGRTELFFSERTIDMRAAQVICSSCPLREPCLNEARSRPPFAGVWGGVIFVNGEELLLKRGRGRPRKSEELDNARILKALGATTIDSEESSDEEETRQIA